MLSRLLSWLRGPEKTLRDATARSSSTGLRDFVCSACVAVKRGAEMRVLPWWNESSAAFFMTHRCTDCYPTSLEESRSRVAAWDGDAERAFVSFLGIWEIERRFPSLCRDTTRESAVAVLDEVERSGGTLFVDVAQGRG